MEMLKSSFKNLQGAVTSMKPLGPICIQETETQSFREGDLYSSFHCPYSTSSNSPSTSFGPSDPHENSFQLLSCLEEDLAFGAAAMAATNITMSSSSPSAEQDHQNWNEPLRGPISSERFFFSPHTTKSIMEEARSEISTRTKALSTMKVSFYEESITMAMSSEDPYHDFRASMEEMVAAHELTEWHSLQELLHCYLRLNERKNHKIILLAFVDLLMHLLDQDKEAISLLASHLGKIM